MANAGLSGNAIKLALQAAGALGGQVTSVENIAELFSDAISKYGEGKFNSVNAVAALISECMMESAYFRTTEEYAKNGRYKPYIGRGFIQITWKENYAKFGAWCKKNGLLTDANYFVKNPARLADIKWAALTGVWYFTDVTFSGKPLVEYAGNIDQVGKAVNLGNPFASSLPNGAVARRAAYAAVKSIGSLLIPATVDAVHAVVGPTVDGIALPSYKTSGTRIKWRPLYHNNNVQANSTCFCVTQAIAVAEARLIKMGVIKNSLDFWQFGYGKAAAASADTHAGGGVVDTVQIDDKTLKVLREVGFTAAWYRGPGASHGNFSTKHIHAVLSGCPHVSNGAASQVVQVRNGQNGLANHAKDDGPNVAYITWKDAVKKYVKQPSKVDKPTDATPATKDEGILDFMTKRISWYNSKAQRIVKAATSKSLNLQWLRIDSKAHVSITFGPAKFLGKLQIAGSGLYEGEVLYVESGAYDVKAGKSVKAGSDPVIRIQGTKSGWFSESLPLDIFMGSKEKGKDYKAMRIRVGSTTNKAVITKVDISGWQD